HRQGVTTIPTLADRSLSIAERLDWLAEWGLGTVSRGDWDNARRPERASQMLPIDTLAPYLSRMKAMASGDHPTDADRLPYSPAQRPERNGHEQRLPDAQRPDAGHARPEHGTHRDDGLAHRRARAR